MKLSNFVVTFEVHVSRIRLGFTTSYFLLALYLVLYIISYKITALRVLLLWQSGNAVPPEAVLSCFSSTSFARLLYYYVTNFSSGPLYSSC